MKKKLFKKKILYISYDGVLEPLGQSQILEYIYNNSRYYSFYLISFEKKNNLKNISKLNKLKNKISKYDINWIYLNYSNKKHIHKVIYNFLKAQLIITNLILFKKIKIIHIRSYIPGIILLPIISLVKIILIFDIRGFLPLEKIERLNWKKNSYKILLLQFIENYLMKKSTKIITLTNQSKNIIIDKFNIKENNISTIPTCANTNLFKIDKSINKKNLKLCFLGSLNFAYDFEKIIKFYKKFIIEFPDIKIDFLINDKNYFIKKLLLKNNFEESKINIKFIEHKNIPKILNNYQFGIFFLKKNESIKASFPTKIGEYLSSGLPIICNDFNDDVTSIVKDNNLGFILKNDHFDSSIYKKIVQYYNENSAIICRNYAEKNLSIKYGSFKYLDIYNSIS